MDLRATAPTAKSQSIGFSSPSTTRCTRPVAFNSQNVALV